MKTEDAGSSVLETWTVEEVAEAFDRNEIVLIDVRTPQEYMFEHVEGALLMPMAFFRAEKLPGQSDKRIVFHCGSGVRSEKVARAAMAAGFDRIAHMEGGFGAWKAAKKPYIGTNMATGAPTPMG
ncbi:rhodanese-like domain-containing protein [Salipiger marinus]|jgi:rhodanese-related sulfurtransferase|uniref:rhodanese-like domain-containing protein n=1 Tax=Salipiger marinus TaxID=555512 RepID=UPI000E8A3100|nr:rhodanese-like domain-containing protein [Salipiger manganoxidans]MCD1617469.1 rhodanese-like domain-containing protein [Salipiger manganoxidans]MEB3417525.1 rhodanese-like domain-containing protein [Salipiger manganoxidans]HBM60997.1 rhodanese-like domain-containing protein [Citreicella sp.]HBS98334.1 rhodanese-like domain-containing protein [Citreicella sp.]|tara:strand:+ start:346 stop:720 length:375 start_codon:yes stop_codon:yes gene_type:complete